MEQFDYESEIWILPTPRKASIDPYREGRLNVFHGCGKISLLVRWNDLVLVLYIAKAKISRPARLAIDALNFAHNSQLCT